MNLRKVNWDALVSITSSSVLVWFLIVIIGGLVHLVMLSRDHIVVYRGVSLRTIEKIEANGDRIDRLIRMVEDLRSAIPSRGASARP